MLDLELLGSWGCPNEAVSSAVCIREETDHFSCLVDASRGCIVRSGELQRLQDIVLE